MGHNAINCATHAGSQSTGTDRHQSPGVSIRTIAPEVDGRFGSTTRTRANRADHSDESAALASLRRHCENVTSESPCSRQNCAALAANSRNNVCFCPLLQLRRLADGRETRLGEDDDGKEKSVLMPHTLSVPEHLVTTSKLHAYGQTAEKRPIKRVGVRRERESKAPN